MTAEPMEEARYYDIIASYFADEMQSRMSSFDEILVRFIPLGGQRSDLSYGITSMLKQMSVSDLNVEAEAQLVRELHVDIAGLAYSKSHKSRALIICELKMGDLRLGHLSQLIGYCTGSNAEFGLLIGIDGGLSRGLRSILDANPHMSKIVRCVADRKRTTTIGFCSWSHKNEEISFMRIGDICDINRFCRHVASHLFLL